MQPSKSRIEVTPAHTFREKVVQGQEYVREYLIGHLLPGHLYRIDVGFRNRASSKSYVTLYAVELWVFLSLVDLVVQYATVVRGGSDMAHVARSDRYLQGSLFVCDQF